MKTTNCLIALTARLQALKKDLSGTIPHCRDRPIIKTLRESIVQIDGMLKLLMDTVGYETPMRLHD